MCVRWWRPGSWSGSGAPIVWPNRSTPCRCRPRCRRCWRRASIGCQPEDKRLLQTAAVIGTEVPWPLLQAIADTSDEALYRSLAQLQAAEFLYETSLFPERAYTFKHALTHEVAYGSLLHERRRALHARIVEALEALAGDRLDDQVERLAHHALRGEVWDKALAYGRQAGDKAQARSAYREAVVCFEQALAALEHLPDSRAATEQAIDLRLGLRTALNALGEAPGRMLDHLRRAETLAQTLGDPPAARAGLRRDGRQFLGGGRGGPRHRLRPARPGPGRNARACRPPGPGASHPGSGLLRHGRLSSGRREFGAECGDPPGRAAL